MKPFGKVVLGLGVALAGCGGCGPQVLVYGRLIDSTGQTPRAAGKVTVAGTSVDTNESGFFSLTVPSDVPLNLVAKVKGYAPTQKSLTAPAQASTFVQVTLLKWDSESTFDAATGGSVSSGSTSITFPANALNASGTVTAHLAYLNPTDDGERSAFPGGFVTTDGKQLESFGAMAVVVEDASGVEVNLKGGQAATAKLEAVSSPADSVPLWSFEESSGRWKQEGSLTGCASGVCEAQLPHLSWWNADQVYETTCLKACAKNKAGGPAIGVSLEARGTNYNGVSYGTTGGDGCACLDVRRSSTVSIVGVTSGGLVGPVSVTTEGTAATCASGTCASLPSPLTIETPKFQAILTWAENPRDLDSHFTGPCPSGAANCTGRFHVSFTNHGSLVESPNAFLDTDDTSGFGPEITTLTQCTAGVYRFSVHRYSGTPGIEASTAKVVVLLPNGSVTERTAPTANPSSSVVWVVGDLTCDAACGCSWAPVDRYTDENSANGYDP